MIELKKANRKIEIIGIIGLGFVGLNLGLFLCEKGFEVIGIDIDKKLVQKVNNGQAPVKDAEVPSLLKKYTDNNQLRATSEISEVKNTDIVFVTVGTPLDENYSPNFDYIRKVANSLAPYLKKEQIIILKSTVVPGTTEIMGKILEEKSGLKVGEDFTLSFCPERLAEGGNMSDFSGSALEDLRKIPVIVGGKTKQDTEIVSEFWKELNVDTVIVSGFKEAEMAKLADNLWIDLNIALANELGMLAEKLGINIWEVISAANTLPKGDNMVNILYPGSGVGGYCLPKDPWFINKLGEDYGLNLKTPKISREINDNMPKHMVHLILELLKELGKEIENSKVTILGLSFKNNTGDLRNTPAKPLIDHLKEYGLQISAYDPWVNEEEAEELFGLRPISDFKEAVRNSDCIVLVSAHPEFREINYNEIAVLTNSKCGIIDGRNALDENNAKKAGFIYRKIGVGVVENDE